VDFFAVPIFTSSSTIR